MVDAHLHPPGKPLQKKDASSCLIKSPRAAPSAAIRRPIQMARFKVGTRAKAPNRFIPPIRAANTFHQQHRLQSCLADLMNLSARTASSTFELRFKAGRPIFITPRKSSWIRAVSHQGTSRKIPTSSARSPRCCESRFALHELRPAL